MTRLRSGLVVGLTTVLATTVAAGPWGPAGADDAGRAAAARQPDVFIRLVDGPWVGKREYFTLTPFETTSELEVQGAGSYRFRFRIQNRGSRRGSFNVLAGRWSTPPADCTYKVVRRGVNLTRKITTTGYVERGLAAGDKTTYKVKIAAAGSDDQCSLEFRAASTRSYAQRDIVIATVANTA